MIYIICGIAIFCLITIIIVLLFKNYRIIQKIEIKINRVEKKIESSLKEKITYYEKINNDLSEEKNLCEGLETLNTDISLIELDNKENEFNISIQNFIDSKKKFNPKQDTKEAIDNLYNENINCNAYKKYYNELANTYNLLINKAIIKQLKKYNRKELFHEIVDERFEILKKK